MNFFQKIFFSTMLIAALTCSLGCYILINSQFETSLGREVNAGFEQNDILWYSLGRELQNTVVSTSARAQILKIAQNVTINTANGPISFQISDAAGNRIYTNSEWTAATRIYNSLSSNTKGYELYQADGATYLHTVTPFRLFDELLYLENVSDITFLFIAKEAQFRTFFFLMAVLIFGVGAITFALSRFLLRPLGNLSLATQEIAGGHFDQRVPVTSGDEIGALSLSFNQMADRVEQMMAELKEAARRQEEFAGSFSHELKTPLTSIIGYADMICTKRMDPERTVRSARYIYTEGKRLEALSRKLMQCFILEKQEFPMQQVSASTFFSQLQTAFAPIFAESQVSLSIDAEDAVLTLEPDLMKTVCINLVDNARKAVGSDGWIKLSGQTADNGYRICVEDNGHGIPEDELSKVTEAFYMVDKSRDRAQGGAGLGLSICAKIVSLHGGQIKFQSMLERGTSVSIFLPGGSAHEA